MNATMNATSRTLLPLLQREWLQHRFIWSLLVLIPIGLAMLIVTFGRIEFDEAVTARPEKLTLILSVVPPMAAALLMLVVALVTGLFTVSVLARRDHGDRSVEFWLSLPVPHSAALAVPMAVHLLLMPAVALLIGWAAGQLLAVPLVGRVAGVDALAEVPWATTVVGTMVLTLRVLAGLPLALLWALPIVLLVVLMYAWFKRWGWVILVAGIALQGLLDELSLGQRWILETAGELLRRAGLSLLGAGGAAVNLGQGGEGAESLARLPAIAAADFGAALAALASPYFIGGLIFSAGCFALLVRWRRAGAGRTD